MSALQIKVSSVTHAEVRAGIEEKRFNSNNFKFADLPPGLQAIETPLADGEYVKILRKTSYGIWKSLVLEMQRQARPDQQQAGGDVELTPAACKIIKTCVDCGLLTNRIPESEKEDLEDAILPLLKPFFPDDKTAYFIRLNDCSPKDGRGQIGPFTNAQEILLSLCTSMRIYKALRNLETTPGQGERLHLLKWRPEISTANEFRMYVPAHGRVTAISQYSLRYNGWDEDDYNKIRSVVPYLLTCNETFRRMAAQMGLELPDKGYVIDMHAVGNKMEDGGWDWIVEPVELNAFGAQLASGSGLFSWAEDWECMYGLTKELHVRITRKEIEEQADAEEGVRRR